MSKYIKILFIIINELAHYPKVIIKRKTTIAIYLWYNLTLDCSTFVSTSGVVFFSPLPDFDIEGHLLNPSNRALRTAVDCLRQGPSTRAEGGARIEPRCMSSPGRGYYRMWTRDSASPSSITGHQGSHTQSSVCLVILNVSTPLRTLVFLVSFSFSKK